MFIEVIPLDFSFDNEWLTYKVPDNFDKNFFKIWILVEIPLKSKTWYWIITQVNSLPSEKYDIKEIIWISCSEQLLSEYQIDTIYYLARKYFVNIHIVLALFLPKFIVKWLEKKNFVIEDNEEKNIFKPVFEKKLEFEIKNKNTLVFNQTKFNNLDFIAFLSSKYKDWVFIVQDDFVIEDFLLQYPSFKKNITIYKNSNTYTKKYKNFLEIYTKTNNFVIWTRKLLTYNLDKYENIFYFEDSFYKDTLSYNHKYKNLDILSSINKNTSKNITIISSVPAIETMYKVHKKEIDYLEIR